MDKAEQEAISFLEKIPIIPESTCKAYSIQSFNKNKPPLLTKAYICHASTHEADDVAVAGASFTETRQNSHMTRMVWDWVTGENSPWKLLHPIYPVYRDDDCINGWYVKEDVVKKVPFNFIKNFMIFTRTVTEYANRFYFWEKAVQSGMDPADAFYLCSFFCCDDKGSIALTSSYPNGGHWAITDQYHEKASAYEYYRKFYPGTVMLYKFNWDGFRKGEIETVLKFGERINGYFLKKREKGDTYDVYSPKNLSKKFIKTKFSEISSYSLEEIKESFYRWQDKMGVRNA